MGKNYSKWDYAMWIIWGGGGGGGGVNISLICQTWFDPCLDAEADPPKCKKKKKLS